MNEETFFKLWVIKFCIKIIYPKLNPYIFLVYVAIKSNYYFRNCAFNHNSMNKFTMKTIPHYILKSIFKEQTNEDILNVSLHKCIFISQANFIQLCVENIFYRDNGLLWVTLKLTPEEKQHYEEKSMRENSNMLFKYNLNLKTSEIHNKLWTNSKINNSANYRVVPITYSPYVHGNTALVSENEFFNIISCMGINNTDNLGISLHPVPAFECSPKIASAAEVCLIVNDFDLSNDFIKEILSNHFEEPRLVSENDLITIELSPLIMAKYHYKYLDLVENLGMLHFKCVKITSDINPATNARTMKTIDSVVKAFYIVKGVTQLTLGENIHSTKPKYRYFKPQIIYNNLNLMYSCPTGLRSKFNQIQDAVHPFLTGEINELSSSLSSPIIPMFLVTGSIGSGRHLLIKILAKYNGVNCLQADCNALQSSTAKQTESKISQTIQKAKAAAPAIVLLDNFEVFAVDPENNEDHRVMEYFMNSITDLYENYTKHSIIFVAITDKVDLKPNIMRMFLDRFHLPRLNVEKRYEMLQWFAEAMQIKISDSDAQTKSNHSINIEDLPDLTLSKHSKEILQRVASKTETFVYGDLDTLVHFALRESYINQHNHSQLVQDPNLQILREEDFNSALEQIRSLQSQHLDAPRIPKVYWDDIGGLEKLKKELLKTIEFPIKFPHLFKNSSLKRSGILLYGPPGCGKTLVAKAVSTELNVSFLSVKGPELLNMYIGQSEENVRKVFESARASSPCIVFLDELDALAPRRGAAGDSGGASDRVVSQLLAELDGVTNGEDAETSSFVFIMGATNRPDLLEQSLLRPGRLDKLIYVGPYSGTQEKTSVLTALCRSYKLRGEVKLCSVAEALPERCTGADLMQVVSTARDAAVRGLVHKINTGLVKETDLSPDSIILGVSELWQGVESFRPSVTEEELAYYESLQYQM
ncbi:peroxisome biogenesis protein 6 [Papilio machaon]|uniref:peroxisome biogenesis protein 6 n=1 Tax=Papilio machaon TaxID=76193 RepID=UPI001E662EEA|nr:peroxisome biogenesis protein 6 [Papilio machaon]